MLGGEDGWGSMGMCSGSSWLYACSKNGQSHAFHLSLAKLLWSK